MNDTVYYSWVGFFKELCEKIGNIGTNAETRGYELYLKAKDTFQESHIILQNGNSVDPFSFIYAFAQRNTVNQRVEYFTNVKNVFNLESDLPSDFIFPTPTPNTPALFCDKGNYLSNAGDFIGIDVIWKLYDEVYHGILISPIYFNQILNLRNVGIKKLTQILFLINPEKYIPLDDSLMGLQTPRLLNYQQLKNEKAEIGFLEYNEILEEIYTVFPECKMYEINLLNFYLFGSNENKLVISNKFCQISSYVEGQKEANFLNDYILENAVWTGGPTSGTGKTEYPLTSYNRGDLVLVRNGTKKLGGIGIILENEYLSGGWNSERMIKIIWLNKKPGRTDDALGQWDGFSRASEKTIAIFEDKYFETFSLIRSLQEKQKNMINFTLDKNKNIILQGPPGTGKTRLAKQIALLLTSEESRNTSLLDTLDLVNNFDIFQHDPEIDGIDEIELIQFHPSYTYEDFVRGIVAKVVENGVCYYVENKVLARIAMTASLPENSHKAYVLIIDEINRANLPSVLGELIYGLEYRGKQVNTMYEYDKSYKISLPDNLYIIGTMNTADRSVGRIDYAIRRRFAFVHVSPKEEVIIHPKAKLLYQKVKVIFDNYTAPDFNKNDVILGHSYFLVDDSEIGIKLKYEILPILNEYLNDGILTEGAKKDINGLYV